MEWCAASAHRGHTTCPQREPGATRTLINTAVSPMGIMSSHVNGLGAAAAAALEVSLSSRAVFEADLRPARGAIVTIQSLVR